MAWDLPVLEVNGLVPSQHAYTESETEFAFTVHGEHFGAVKEELHLVLVRSDLRLNLIHDSREAVVARLRPADVIPVQVDALDSERQAKCKALLRERPPGTYDLIATRPPVKPSSSEPWRNNANVLRSALEILEPVLP